jgi:acetyl-CoA C-acetyltransferase
VFVPKQHQMDRSRVPVIVGVAQHVVRERTPTQLDPLAMMADAGRAALRDARARAPMAVDTLYIVHCASRPLAAPAQALSQLLDIHPTECGYSAIGATAPQWYVARAADRIERGETRWALVCGAEAFYTHASLPNLGQSFGEYFDPGSAARLRERYVGDIRAPVTRMEFQYGLVLPIHMYGLIENDLRARSGLSLDQHRLEIAEFVARSSRVAGGHPYAHRPQVLAAADVAAVGPDNRMVSFPYVKRMCSNLAVNQAAALVVTSWASARDAGVPDDQIVFVRGTGAAEDAFYVTERPRISASPSVVEAVRQATEQACTSLDEIAHFDLYSCFPCAPRIVMDMLGIRSDDPRAMTVTGGMSVFGGPGNNYTTHAIATMVERLRREPSALGLVHALSWYLSKHAVGVYGATPPEQPRPRAAPPVSYPQLAPIAEPSGPCRVESYVLGYSRDGAPDFATVVGRDRESRRFLARVHGDRAVLEHMAREEPIGRGGTVSAASSGNRFTFTG